MNTRRQVVSEITSSAAAQVNSEPIRIDGEGRIEVHFTTSPAALSRLEMSADGVNWVVAVDLTGAGITALAAVYVSVRERPKWIRHSVLTDAGGPRLFRAVIHILVQE